MGAWGTAAFDNDDASDWVYELEKDGIAAVEAALRGGPWTPVSSRRRPT